MKPPRSWCSVVRRRRPADRHGSPWWTIFVDPTYGTDRNLDGLEGSATLWQEGKEDELYQAGEAFKIPLKQVHTAITGDEGVTALVFRVHETGKPERVMAE